MSYYFSTDEIGAILSQGRKLLKGDSRGVWCSYDDCVTVLVNEALTKIAKMKTLPN